MRKTNNECCPELDAQKWDNKEIVWNEKLFIEDKVTGFFHIPLNFAAVVKRNMAKIQAAGASVPDWLMLNEESSMWGSQVYIAVDKIIPGAKMVSITGVFLSKVFDGHYSKAGKFAEEMKKYVSDKGKECRKIYFYYAYCPKCAKKYKKNHIVLFAQV